MGTWPALQPLVRLAPRRALVAAIRWYQRTVSPLTPPACRYTPTCSQYAAEAIARYGVFYGGALALWRLARCQPWGGHGWDPPRPFGTPAPPAPWDGPATGPSGDRTETRTDAAG